MIETTRRRRRISAPSAPATPLSWAWTGLLAIVRDNIVASVLAMILAVPLLTGTSLLNDRGKVVTFEALGTALLVLVLVRVEFRLDRLRETLFAGPNLAIVLLALLSFASCAFSPYRAFSLLETMRVGFCVLLYFVMVGCLRGKGHLQTLTDGLLAVTAAVALLSFLQMGEGVLRVSSDNRLQGTFGSHELLGSFLLLMLPLALALGLTERGDSRRQLAAQVVALLAAGCLLMARARFAWVGGGVSLIALSLLSLRYFGLSKSLQPGTANTLRRLRERRHLIVGPLLILGGALALFVLLSRTGSELHSWAATIPHAENFGGRIAMWRGTLRMIEARPLFGWGIGTYPVREVTFTGLGDSVANVLAHGTSHSNIAHNFYLQTAAELGLVGLGFYLAAVIGFFTAGLRALQLLDTGLRKAVLLGCLAAMAGQVVDAFGSPAYNFASVALFQWVVMGLGMFAAGLGARTQMSSPERESLARAPRGVSAPLLRRVQYGLTGLVALAIVAQIVPTMRAAMAQTCTLGSVSYVFRGVQGQDSGYTLTGTNSKVSFVGYANGKPVTTGTQITVTGRTDLVLVGNFQPASRLDITRNSKPGSGAINILSTYTDPSGTQYTTTLVINLR